MSTTNIEWGGSEPYESQFDQVFPSLLSICKDMPPQIKVAFSWNGNDFTSRFMFMKALERKLTTTNTTHLTMEYTNLNLWRMKEQRVRTNMRILLNKWIQKKYSKRILNTDDPCTLNPPVKCIKVFDFKSRGIYNFEASSLKKQFETALLYSEWLFSVPSHPKNPLTNIEFNEGQRLVIIDEMRKYGYGSWSIEAYKQSRWNLRNFSLDNSTQIKIHSINEMCKNPNEDTKEILKDFIIEQYEENDINNLSVKNTLKWAVKNRLNDPYMIAWLKLMKEYYTLKFRYFILSSDDDKLNVIYVRSMILFDDYDKINEFRMQMTTGPHTPPLISQIPILDDSESENIEIYSSVNYIPGTSTVVYYQTIEEIVTNIINNSNNIVETYLEDDSL